MQEAFVFSAYARQVGKFSKSLLGSVGSGAELAGFVHLLNVAMERDLTRFRSDQQRSRIACGPGCGSCCILNVAVLFPEAVAISRFIARHFSAPEGEALRTRMRELHWQTRWLDDEERLYLREPCAFLDRQGHCKIHVVRPLLCRAVTSTDAGACREAIALAALNGVPSVEMDLFQKQLIETVYGELGRVLECLDLDHQPKRLVTAVLALLDEPDLVARFLRGEKVPLH